MNILVINCGSTSLKYQVINMENESVLCKGIADRIGIENSKLIYKAKEQKHEFHIPLENHKQALKEITNKIFDKEVGVLNSLEDIIAIGHRVVHGGDKFSDSILIDDEVIKAVEDCSKLAPLHNPANLMGIYACKEFFTDKPNIAVFDTAFHQTMPKKAFIYAIPIEFYEKDKIRKYGFHGTSHKFVSQRLSQIMNKPLEEMKVITCHLGGGASIAAIENGKVIDTSMGFTPLQGLVMGTRCGDIDPSIITYLIEKKGFSSREIDNLLNKKSGVLGLSGISSDMRDIEKEAFENKNPRAQMTLDIFHYSIIKYIGAYAAAMNGVDAIVFTGGIGEGGYETREEIMKNLEYLGININKKTNKTRRKEVKISIDNSKVSVYVIPTNEELMIARETKRILEK